MNSKFHHIAIVSRARLAQIQVYKILYIENQNSNTYEADLQKAQNQSEHKILNRRAIRRIKSLAWLNHAEII